MSGVAPVVFSVLSFAFVSPLPDGRREKVMFDKITSRISKLCYGLNGDFVDPVSTLPCLLSLFLPLPLPACLPPPPSLLSYSLCVFSPSPSLPPSLPSSSLLQAEVTQKVISGVYSGVTTIELDTLAAETAATMTTKHPDYAILAARIAVSNLHKETKKVFSGE